MDADQSMPHDVPVKLAANPPPKRCRSCRTARQAEVDHTLSVVGLLVGLADPLEPLDHPGHVAVALRPQHLDPDERDLLGHPVGLGSDRAYI